MVFTVDWLYIEVAFVIATFFLGLFVGWKYMAIWTVAVFFATMAADAIGPRLGLLINKFLSVGAQFIAIGTGKPEGSISAPSIAISDAQLPLAQAILFLVLTLFTIWVARKLGNKRDVGLLGLLTGGIFGALGTVIALGKLADYYKSYVAKSNNDFLANSLNLTLPGVTFGSANGSGAGSWAGLGGIALAAFLMLFIIYVIWRVVRTVL